MNRVYVGLQSELNVLIVQVDVRTERCELRFQVIDVAQQLCALLVGDFGVREQIDVLFVDCARAHNRSAKHTNEIRKHLCCQTTLLCNSTNSTPSI